MSVAQPLSIGFVFFKMEISALGFAKIIRRKDNAVLSNNLLCFHFFKPI